MVRCRFTGTQAGGQALGEWPSLFGDPLMASAALDRLADNANVLIVTGSSYRARDRQALYFPTKE
jgi:hypothetical protein